MMKTVSRAIRRLLVLGAFLAAAFSLPLAGDAAAQSYRTQDGYAGKTICGGVDLKTDKLLPSCGSARATKKSKAVGECPKGSFFDIGTWSCFTCPRGFDRTGFAVDTPKACSKDVTDTYRRATRVSSHKSCRAGSFKDPRNGGECWKCPTGYGRTASSVTEWDACGKAFATARKATFVDRVCPVGTFPDPNGGCYQCPDGYHRTAGAVTAHDACVQTELLRPANKEAALTCPAGQHFDFVDGGTCWSCPKNSTRSISSVKSDKACEYTNIRYEPAKRTPNGLFGLPGGHHLAAQLIAEKKPIDDAITKLLESSKPAGKNPHDAAWDVIRESPKDSPVLVLAAFSRLMRLIKEGPETKEQRALLDYVAVYVQQSRQLSAIQMRDAYESWRRGMDAKRRDVTGNNANLAATFDIGHRPPDMGELVADTMAMVGTESAVWAMYGATYIIEELPSFKVASKQIGRLVFPFRKGTKEVIVQGVKQTVKTSAGLSSAATGPFIILTVAAVVGEEAINIVADQVKQESIIADALARSKERVDLTRLIKTEEGRAELLTNWSLMTAETIPPDPRVWKALTKKTTSSVDVPKNITVRGNTAEPAVLTIPLDPRLRNVAWQRMDTVAARDIAISSIGSLFLLTQEDAGPEGGAVQILSAHDRSRWKTLKGGGQGARITTQGKTPWFVTESRKIYFRSGRGKWVQVNGPKAIDIAGGTSDRNIWIVDQGARVFRLDGNAWQKVPGVSARRIAMAGDTPWVTDTKGAVHWYDGRKWVQQGGVPAALAIGASEKGVWVLAGNEYKHGYEVYAFDSGGWVKTPGHATDIAVAPNGMPLLRNSDGNVYAVKQ